MVGAAQPIPERSEIYWADLGGSAGRRPVVILTRDAAISVLTSVTCAPITRTIRGIRSEVAIGGDEGLPETCAINCDSLLTIRISSLDRQPVGQLGRERRAELDRALRYALDIIY